MGVICSLAYKKSIKIFVLTYNVNMIVFDTKNDTPSDNQEWSFGFYLISLQRGRFWMGHLQTHKRQNKIEFTKLILCSP